MLLHDLPPPYAANQDPHSIRGRSLTFNDTEEDEEISMVDPVFNEDEDETA